MSVVNKLAFYKRFVRPSCVCAAFGLLSALGAARGRAQMPEASSMQAVPKMMPPVMDNRVYTHVLFNQLEGRSNGDGSGLRWDGEAWVGTDMNRLWLKSEGLLRGDTMSDGTQEVLYDRPLPRMRYFDAQMGIREDLDSGPRRTWGAVGIEGLAPYFFNIEPTFYFRDGGNVAGRVTGSYDLLLTQHVVLQSQAELNFYSKADPERGTGSGFSDLDAGVRVRYAVSRKFAPYVGFAYAGKYGGTATYSRQAGEAVVRPTFVFGIRVWH